MISIEKMFALLRSITGFADKVTYYEWPLNEAPALPFICFFSEQDANFGADNINYFHTPRFSVELYTKARDLDAEAALEAAFTSAGLFYTKESAYLNDERCQMTVYTI